jgi:hypothetical protein
MRPISAARWLSHAVAVEREPLSRGLVAVFCGVLQESVTPEADAGGYRENAPGALEPVPVIVRVLHDDGEDPRVHELFLRVAAHPRPGAYPSPAGRFPSWHDLDAALAGLQAIHAPVGNRVLAAYVRSILGELPGDPAVKWSLES